MSPTNQQDQFDQLVRGIVREELANIFASNNESSPSMFRSQGGQTAGTTSQRRAAAGRKGGRVRSIAKGQVTDPAKDRRLKVNRDAKA